VLVEISGTAHRLAGVVDDEIEPVARLQNFSAERFDAGRVPEIQSVDLDAILPLVKVGLA